MVRNHSCCNCGNKGKIYLPIEKPINTVVKCYWCKKYEDISFYYDTHKTLEEIEWEEYQRLKKKFG